MLLADANAETVVPFADAILDSVSPARTVYVPPDAAGVELDPEPPKFSTPLLRSRRIG